MTNWLEKTKRPVLPIYLAALVWPIMALVLPIYTLGGLIATAVISAGVYIAGTKLCPVRVVRVPVAYATGSEDVDALLNGVTANLDALHKLNDEIPDKQLSDAMDRMEKAGRSIADTVAKTPDKARNIDRFARYYLPEMVKLMGAYAELEKQVRKVRPKMLVAGASAYPRAIDFEKLAEIAHGYGAYLMVDMAHIAGLVAGGQHQSPVPYADVVTTTTHKTLRGPRGGLILTNNPIIAKRINSAVFPGTQGGPLEHVIAAKAVCFGEALKPEFKEYARKIVENAQAMAAELQARGVKLVSGGTDNHLMLIDLRDEECTGKELEHNLDEVHITANKNTVPGEKRSPFVTSGVRIGTPAVTTRGMGVDEMKVIADCIADCIFDFAGKKDDIAKRVADLTAKFPLYE